MTLRAKTGRAVIEYHYIYATVLSIEKAISHKCIPAKLAPDAGFEIYDWF